MSYKFGQNLNINVRDFPFNAKGDGITDDFTALQNAFNSISNGGTIYIPDTGSPYLISAGLVINQNNTTICGDGYGSIIKAKNGSNFINVLSATNLSGLIIHSLSLDANQDGRAGVLLSVTNPLLLTSCTDCMIHDITVSNARGTSLVSGAGISLSGTCARCQIVSCQAFNCGSSGHLAHGFYTTGNQNIISSCIANTCTDTAFVIDSSNFCGIVGCISYNCGSGGSIIASSNTDYSGNYINGLTVKGQTNTTNGAVSFGLTGNSSDTANLLNTSIDSLTIITTGTGPAIGFLPITPDGRPGKTQRFTLHNTHIQNLSLVSGGGIVLNADDLEISGGIFNSTVAPIKIQRGSNILIHDAQVYTNDTYAILGSIGSLDSVEIRDNLIQCGSATSWGIYFIGTNTNIRTRGNTITGSGLLDEGGIGADTTTAPRSNADTVFRTALPAINSTGLWPLGIIIFPRAPASGSLFAWRVTTAGLANTATFEQLNFGSTTPTIITNNTTISSGINENVMVGAITAPITITLPTSPTLGQSVNIKDAFGNAATFNITINGNGKNIDANSSQLISINYGIASLLYNGTSWSIV